MIRFFLIFLIQLYVSFSFALEIGGNLQTFSLDDQHEVKSKVDESVKYLLFAKDKKASKLIEEAFKEVEKDYFT